MATGIPLNNKSAKMDYQLSYEGKEDIDSILSAKSKTHYKLQEQISFSEINPLAFKPSSTARLR